MNLFRKGDTVLTIDKVVRVVREVSKNGTTPIYIFEDSHFIPVHLEHSMKLIKKECF